ncbi:HNH endonuclease [Clostridium hydrogenum]|uniref:HNH endonuclease n=1 Tax=Clostridium hydrogenum TaxID=2855764 RepID=UPI001F377260|nr:HNH endonuclease signature motif containing protein [Clostridium hydrogenum]
MKKINKPKNDIIVILDNCIANMNNPRKEHIEKVKTSIIEQTTKYDNLATVGQLFTIHEHDNVNHIATKDDMEALYKQKFVPKDQPNREFYDKIMLLAPNGKCPYCKQNIANNLDHFLPKSKYVTFTVTPYNLVPSCSACNTDKLASTFSSYLEQPFHPYYDDFDDSVWLKAKLIENEDVSFQFYADPPSSIDAYKAERIKQSFSIDGFGLNNIYKVHAPEVYQSCFHRIKILFDKGGKSLAVNRLIEYIEDEQSININSWKAAMYQAMINSDWYWDIYLPRLV